MPVDETPNDGDVRQSYNFAPGYHGLVYRADGPEHGGQQDNKEEEAAEVNTEGATAETKYKLQSMQWGMFFATAPDAPAHMASQDWSLSGRSATRTTAAR